MTRSSIALLTTLFGTMACGTSQAQASFVPWSYNWSRAPIAVQADAPGTGGLSLTDEPLKNADGTSDVVATNIRGFSSASRSAPDHFTSKAYTLSLFLKDNTSGESATFNFKGVFNGTLSATSANITTVFDPTLLSQTHTLGGHVYSVTLGSFAPPGPPTASNAGSISAHVGVDEVPDQPPPPPPGPPTTTGQAPEPSTLLLSCLGLSGLGMAGWRRWRGERG